MANIRAARSRKTPVGPLAKLREKKANGAVSKPVAKGALAALKAKKTKPKVEYLPSTKRAVVVNGVRFDRCRQSDRGTWWMLDVTNGDKQVTFHNRYGAWFHDESNGAERGIIMREPEACFPELRNVSTPRALSFAIVDYWVRELHHLKLPATQRERELAKEKEIQEAKQRKSKPLAGLKKGKQGGALAKLKARKQKS
jgi:hypothetical protein